MAWKSLCNSPSLDRSIVDIGLSEDASYLHGFESGIEQEATAEVPKVWMPILGEDKIGHFERIFNLVEPEIVSAVRHYSVALETLGGCKVVISTLSMPHEVALDIMRGKSPILAFRSHQGITLRELSERTGIAAGYISEVERGLKPGSTSALARIASALGTTIDVLVNVSIT